MLQFCATAAVAQSDDNAQLLFEQGRDLLKLGNVEEACPKLEQSVSLEVATGALLALAMCHEKAGKFATAWAEYGDVQRRAARDGQEAREQWASERVTALRPLLSTLTIQISDELARLRGLQVWRDGLILEPEAWNVAVPVDGGTHRLKVTAPAHETWQTTLTVRQQGDSQLLEVPLLSALQVNADPAPDPGPRVASVATTPAASSPRPPVVPAAPVAEGWSPTATQFWGVGLVGASLASFATSGVMLYHATTLSGESDSALAWGNGATAFALGGGALAVVGAALLIWGGETEAQSRTAKFRFEVSPTAMAVGVDTVF